jgi:hypothetical protein
MKPLLASLVVALITAHIAHSEDLRPDLRAPKPEGFRNMRVLLYVPGSARLLDYPDVSEILCCDQGQITFETVDGFIITHQGAFTIMQAKNSVKALQHPLRGPRFYDSK